MELLEKLGTEYSNYFHQADIAKEVIHEHVLLECVLRPLPLF